MKKVILTLVVSIFVAASSFAQPKQHKGEKSNFTPEQKATLMIKKMALSLDLSSSQQQKIKPILLAASTQRENARKEHMANKKAGNKLSGDEKYSMMNQMLDKKLAFQAQMKKVLNEDQFKKWKKTSAHRSKAMKGKKGSAKKGKKGKGKHHGDKKKQCDHKGKQCDNA